jgi:hypothetical protein
MEQGFDFASLGIISFFVCEQPDCRKRIFPVKLLEGICAG